MMMMMKKISLQNAEDCIPQEMKWNLKESEVSMKNSQQRLFETLFM